MSVQPQRKISIYIILSIAFIFILLLFTFPQQSLEAGVRGIAIWWEVLFPALFPFFVLSELMLGFGIVHFVGTLLDPLMKPVFRVTGKGGFVMAMGFASGYPVGARLTAQLWSQGLISREEGERLVAFTSTSDPIFLIGAVSVGFFHSPELALVLAVVHYSSSLIVGWLMRFHGQDQHPVDIHESREHKRSPQSPKKKTAVLWSAFQQMHIARMNDGRSFWQLLEQSVRTSILLVFMIGGLVVFFSVLIEVATASAFLPMITSIIGSMLNIVGLPPTLSASLVNGLFEVTLGAQTAAQAGDSIALVHKVAIASVVLAWAGLSVHAQIVSLLNHTNLRYAPFVFARALHAVLAFLLVIIFWKPLYAASSSFKMSVIGAWLPSQPSSFANYPLIVILFLLCVCAFLLFTIFIYLLGKFIKLIGRKRL